MNALALVESVLSLTRSDDAIRYSAAVRRRIGAIARVHRILAQSSWQGTPLDQLIAEQAGDRLKVRGPPATVAPRLAQPLAIVFHELISNAERHGALLDNQGEVTIDWETAPNCLVVSWVERGAERPVAQPEPGLGLTLIRSVIER